MTIIRRIRLEGLATLLFACGVGAAAGMSSMVADAAQFAAPPASQDAAPHSGRSLHRHAGKASMYAGVSVERTENADRRAHFFTEEMRTSGS